jgi:transposase
VQQQLEAEYDRLVKRALRTNPGPIRVPGQVGRARASPAWNIAERLRRYKDAVLRFLRDFSVPFDNNLAERDLRMSKVKQKVSGCFRSLVGAQCYATIRGFISTARKQGFTALEALRAVLEGRPLALNLG